MNIHTPSENIKKALAFCVAITAAVVNGASVDCLGFENAFASFYSNPSGGGTTSDCKLQESADNATWVDVAGAAFTQVTTAGGAKLLTMNIKLEKRLRYLRLVHTGAGGAAAGQATGSIDLLNARYNPVEQANPAVSV
ncbi:MAG TPA: hypothetical protein VF556_17665 [Pyrinomonadaceae bacterium]